MINRRWISIGLTLLFGCVDAEYVKGLETRIGKVEKENMELRADMEAAWANALCSDDVHLLIDSVNQKCQQSLRNAGDRQDAGFCTDTDIALAVLVADPKHQGRFLSLMRSQRHTVLYIAPGSTSISVARAQGFQRLIGQRLLPTTRFLIATQSGPNPRQPVLRDARTKAARPAAPAPAAVLAEGRRRVNLIADHLAESGVPRDRMLKWLFSFPLDRAEMDRQDDLPRLGEPDDLYTSVWVFRVDCQLDSNSGSTARGAAHNP